MKFIIGQELRETVLRNMKTFLASVLAFALVCIAIGISLDNYIYAVEEQAVMEETYGNKTFYKIIVNGENSEIQAFFSEGNVEKIKDFFDAINSDSDFEYRYSHTNPIQFFDLENEDYNEDDFPAYPETAVNGYETGEVYGGTDYLSLKGVWVDHYFGTDGVVSLSSGRWFTDEEYYIDSTDDMSLPVILGSEYEGLYELGDTIEHAHLGSEADITLTVVGILEEGSYFYDNNNDKVILDRYMVVPEPEVSDAYPYIDEDGNYDSFFVDTYNMSKIMNCRIVCSSEKAEAVLEKIKQILQETKLYEIDVSDETAGATLELEDARISTTSTLMVCLFIVLMSIIVYIIQMNYRLVRDRKKYNIMILNGVTKSQLFWVMIQDSLLVFALSDILYTAFWLINIAVGEYKQIVNGSVWIFPVIIVLQIFMLVGLGIYGIWRLTHAENMSMALRENE